ncbi:MAG: hypothetical protein M3Q19_10520, partial [Pseudomonadota bacterium]|nr:hypothetical protein [Pseudomonadota bacterium]
LERGRATTAAGHGTAKAGLDALDLGEIVHAAVAEGARRFLQGFEEAAAVAAAAPPVKKPRPRRRPAAPRSPA